MFKNQNARNGEIRLLRKTKVAFIVCPQELLKSDTCAFIYVPNSLVP